MRALRLIGLAWGLTAALGVLLSRSALQRYAASLAQDSTSDTRPARPGVAPPTMKAAPSRAVARARLVLGSLGMVALLTGVWKVLQAVQPASYVWLLVWLAGAVVLHDAVLAPVLAVLRAGVHRGLPALPERALTLIKAGFLIGGLLVLVVVPEIWAQHLGPLNPTVLPGDYTSRLLTTLALIALLTALFVAAVLLRARVRRRHPTDGRVLR